MPKHTYTSKCTHAYACVRAYTTRPWHKRMLLHMHASRPLYAVTHRYLETNMHVLAHKQAEPIPNVRNGAVKTMLAACFLALLMAPPHLSVACSVVVRREGGLCVWGSAIFKRL